MEDVLAAHWSVSTHTESKPFVDKCDGCGAVILTWGDSADMPAQLAKHQAHALAAAGFGSKHDAWAEGVTFGHNHDLAYANDNPYPPTEGATK